MDAGAVKAKVDGLMPGLLDDLKQLVRIPSIASPGFPPDPLMAAHDLVAGWLREVGLSVESVPIEGKTAPVVFGRCPAPDGAPTVLLYTHYDVVPAGDEQLWHTPPFEPVDKDGAILGRGVADSKSNITAIRAALSLFEGRFPVGLVVVVEGQEEVGSPFDVYPPKAPELFACDAMVIADVGSVRPGTPTLTVALRGSAQVDIEIRTLAGDKHSGQYGGAAPDARLAMIRLLASLHDDAGDVAVKGLLREEWTGASYTDEEFASLAEKADGTPWLGSGGLGERIWSGPAITVVGFDAPPTSAPINAVAGRARATLNVRVHPRQPAAQAQQAVIDHLRAQRPFGIEAVVTAGEAGDGFAASLGGPAFDAASQALSEAWDGAETVQMAGGGSIPIVMALHEAAPQAETLMFGTVDSFAHIHAPNERVLVSEIRNAAVAFHLFLRRYADTRRQARR